MPCTFLLYRKQNLQKGMMEEFMKSRITQLLGIEHPIIQGGMAWVAENHLCGPPRHRSIPGLLPKF